MRRCTRRWSTWIFPSYTVSVENSSKCLGVCGVWWFFCAEKFEMMRGNVTRGPMTTVSPKKKPSVRKTGSRRLVVLLLCRGTPTVNTLAQPVVNAVKSSVSRTGFNTRPWDSSSRGRCGACYQDATGGEHTPSVKTTPQMTRFRDAKVCNNWLQIRNDDHRMQSDYKYKSELQNPEGKKSVLGITSAW